jgi:hypothetical protein
VSQKQDRLDNTDKEDKAHKSLSIIIDKTLNRHRFTPYEVLEATSGPSQT